jgi:hypothetical protein
MKTTIISKKEGLKNLTPAEKKAIKEINIIVYCDDEQTFKGKLLKFVQINDYNILDEIKPLLNKAEKVEFKSFAGNWRITTQ